MQKQIQQDYFQNDEPAIKSQLTSSIMGHLTINGIVVIKILKKKLP